MAFGLVFAYRDPMNYHAAYRQVGGSAFLTIVRVMGGVETVLARTPINNPGKEKPFQVQVTFSASTIVLTSGNRSVTASNAGVTPGGVGLMVDGSGWYHSIDNFTAAP